MSKNKEENTDKMYNLLLKMILEILKSPLNKQRSCPTLTCQLFVVLWYIDNFACGISL